LGSPRISGTLGEPKELKEFRRPRKLTKLSELKMQRTATAFGDPKKTETPESSERSEIRRAQPYDGCITMAGASLNSFC